MAKETLRDNFPWSDAPVPQTRHNLVASRSMTKEQRMALENARKRWAEQSKFTDEDFSWSDALLPSKLRD